MPDRTRGTKSPVNALRSIAVALLVALSLVAGLPFNNGAPTAQAASGLKAVVIVGPSGDSTSFFLDIGAKLADQAQEAGMEVSRIFHPRATAERVLKDIQGANLVVYLGHGNGWPSPYAPFQERTKNGFGLNPVEGGSQTNHVYRGANWIRQNVDLAPNAVAILIGACYSSGNGEPGMPVPSQDVAKQRVDNFASGLLGAGAGAVFAFGWEQRANIPALLANSNKTVDEIFMTRSNGSPSGWVGWSDKYLESERTGGATIYLDPHSSYGYYRAVTGNLQLTAAEFRGGEAPEGDSGGSSTPTADDMAPSVPDGLQGTMGSGRKVTLSWDASTDNKPGALSYRIFRNNKRIKSGQGGTSFVDTPASDGNFNYQVAAVDAAGNISAKSAKVTVEVTSAGDSSSSTVAGPSKPRNLSADSMGNRRIGLSWRASTSSKPVKYLVFRDGTRIAQTAALEFVDRPRRVGTYSYTVRAIDSADNRSDFSAPVNGTAVKAAN